MRIEFNSPRPAPPNPRNGVWTDLIWAGNNIIAEVPGSQTATPTWRLLDHEGSLVATTDNSGNINSSNLLAPYGQLMASNTSDPYLYAGLYQDTEYGGHAAWYRNYSAEQARWLRPDPYNGSYDLMNPQSFNRYAYTNGNPLGYVDPSGLAGGLTGWGGVCTLGKKVFKDLPSTYNPCNPIVSIAAYAIANTALDGAANFLADNIDSGINAIFGTSLSTSISASAQQIAPFINAAITIACSVNNFNAVACGPSGWTSAVFGNGSDVGKAVNDGIALTGAILCATGPTSPECAGYIIYSVFNSIFAYLWGGPQFTGSLLPRPSDLGGLGTAPIGIPNNNLPMSGILGSPAQSIIPTPAY